MYRLPTPAAEDERAMIAPGSGVATRPLAHPLQSTNCLAKSETKSRGVEIMSENSNARPTAGMDRPVVECFDALIAAINNAADGWRMRAAEAYLDRDDAGAQECARAIKCIAEAAADAETLYDKLKRSWPAASTPFAFRSLAHNRKRPGSKLRVQLNGNIIEHPDAAETFARTIEEIGIERVARLGKTLSGIALIGTSRATDYQQQFAIGDFYVCTHSNTQTKKSVLDQIAAELGLHLRAEVVSENGGSHREI